MMLLWSSKTQDKSNEFIENANRMTTTNQGMHTQPARLRVMAYKQTREKTEQKKETNRDRTRDKQRQNKR